MRLVGIEIKNFRSIGSEPVTLHPFSKCNLIVGQNNIGKSGVLYGVRKLISIARGDKHSALTELDLHNRDKSRPVRFTLFFEMDGGGSENESAIRSVSGGSSLVFEFEKAIRGELTVTNHTLAHVASLQAANVVMSKLFNETFGSGASKSGIERELIKRGIPIFNSLCRSYLPELSIIPEFRQLQTAKGENPLDGSGLIETLATWQHPDIGSEAMRVRFDAISGFVTELLGMQNAHLEILHSRDTIVLETNGLRLPLSSFGTGVHQLLILVSALISNENALVCVEEPDTHLHPRLQRALVKFMLQHTTNTYLVATHSPALINIANSEPQAKTFHLTLGVDGTRGAPILTQKHIRDVIQDLGVLPSDLVQANAIIWVEGPSDCVYIRHWLNLIDPSLSEGRDFTFASYNGGQLAHFNFDAADVDDLINVLHISQRTILVVDRDRDDDKSAIASQKQKAIAASAAQGGFGWTTHGRAIENYIPATVVNRACQEVLNVSVDFTYSQFKDFGQSFVSALRRAGVKNVDWHEPKAKVRWARRFMAQFTEADLQPELRSTLNTIVSQLRRWNY